MAKDLTPSEAAQKAEVNVQTIYTWIRRGLGGVKLVAIKKQGRVVIRQADFDRFIQETTSEL